MSSMVHTSIFILYLLEVFEFCAGFCLQVDSYVLHLFETQEIHFSKPATFLGLKVGGKLISTLELWVTRSPIGALKFVI